MCSYCLEQVKTAEKEVTKCMVAQCQEMIHSQMLMITCTRIRKKQRVNITEISEKKKKKNDERGK